ncbi:SDR family NAD(P)-dependent oxidoreductase [Halorientalis regularis]|jgi:NAD(P)-dependent dehydrogenase (short-subunit alcohol dehydrogenase family)|uniref:NAD(P)-dependent dehydrogenase, short-chain alcohol dehydrogenase family n=1 Tax=Halorientalis regularis TaxID=660518 RepID=A0A1G7N8G8_9EURY|nr:SDR family NAD(P)-dependent oxidoreductase [Halorientalis regularis]SDF70365.1 NAD(P)-dependent dehydrogenase, short-chain alcohol dehydrogenase family [Halorientalis regularis]
MLDGQTALVTGASQGIGRSIAIVLANHGADVALGARGDGIYETAELIGDDAETLPVELDVTDEASVRDAVEATVDAFGALDVLVNNAGIGGPTAPIEEVTVEEWDRTQDVNLRGAFLMCKHAAPHLRESDQGSVINISSIAGKDPYPTRTPYSASKAGMIGFGRSLAYELGDDDVTVNTICPGAVEGDRIERMIERQADERGVSFEEAMAERVTDRLPLDSIVAPEDVGELVAYLASDHARNLTAQDINLDSGARQD